jgi:hypothetical protein
MSVNVEELVEVYISMRTERERLLREYEESDNRLKDDMKTLEAALLSICNDVGADSFKTASGTVFRKVNERAFAANAEAFFEFVRETGAVELLEKRIHQGNFKQYMEEHKDEGLPPGVSLMREYGVVVRKPTK